MFGAWKPIGANLPMLILSRDGRAALHIPEDQNHDLFGAWRIENTLTLVLVLDIPPQPDSHIEMLRDGTKEALRFKIVESSESTMTLENDDGSISVQYERVGDDTDCVRPT
jgi:hypothetical protein